MRELRPGDRALVVQCPSHPHMVGLACRITELGYVDWGPKQYHGDFARVAMDEGGAPDWFYTYCLIRLPPDSEMQQMFRETERPKETV